MGMRNEVGNLLLAFVLVLFFCFLFFFFFFFQAEDGIRDTSVTGVQTCALPICLILVESIFSSADSAVVST